MGNTFAYAVLIIWPVLSIYWYQTKSIQRATIWTLLGGFMFLPVRTEIDFPMIPAMGKHTIPALSALVGCYLIRGQRISYIRGLGKAKYLVAILLTVPLITASLNGDAIIVAGRILKGLDYYDGLSFAINQFLIVVPFFIGREVFKTYADQLLMFKALVVAGLFYSMLMLFEVRMSPQLHTWVYGYFPHSFAQQMRSGSFRPVVFMGHGLLVSFFSTIAFVSAIALWNNRVRFNLFIGKSVSCYLFVVLMLCKSYASIMYGVLVFLLIIKTKVKNQSRIAIILMSFAMIYPIISITKIFPDQIVINLATSINKDRADSLKFRFDNEDVLLSHGRERLFFGWGGWGRNRVYNEVTGKDQFVTDGHWIITFGQFGLIGFFAEFGLLAVAILRARQAIKLMKLESEQKLLSAHMLVVAIIMIDQLPNSSLAPWLWLLAGILLGRSESVIATNKDSRLLTKQK